MPDLEFFDRYDGQTLDELIALAVSHRVDSLVLAMETALDQKVERDGPKALSHEERVILAIEALEREVNNGGYDAFFRNSSRKYAAEVEMALRSIGCPQHAAIAAGAVKALGIRGNMTEDSFAQALDDGGDALVDALQACDEQYYETTEDIAGQLFAFVKANRSRIRLR